MSKTNAIRILESSSIPYTIHTYEVDDDEFSGLLVAQKTGQDPDSVFKTLALFGDKNEIFIFSVPVTAELSLKKAALACGSKKVELVPVKELFTLTGYKRGGFSPIGTRKKFTYILDETAELFEKISISAGVKGMQIIISPEDLIKVTDANTSDLI